MKAWHGLKVSPVYDLLTFLKEPDWKSLRVAGIKEFWDSYKEWADRVEVARERNRPGNILVLADEAPTWVLRLEAYHTAGKALLSLGHFDFALEQYQKALEFDPTDLESRRQKGLILGRCGKHDEAKRWLKRIVEDHPEDAETWAFVGRIEKDAWLSSWRQEGKTAEEMQLAATDADAYLREAIEAYTTGFRKNPTHYYSGINAVTLMHLLNHLTGKVEKTEDLKAMEGGCAGQFTLNWRGGRKSTGPESRSRILKSLWVKRMLLKRRTKMRWQLQKKTGFTSTLHVSSF
jgi:tetratricopeptide (TPR) repeat protein